MKSLVAARPPGHDIIQFAGSQHGQSTYANLFPAIIVCTRNLHIIQDLEDEHDELRVSLFHPLAQVHNVPRRKRLMCRLWQDGIDSPRDIAIISIQILPIFLKSTVDVLVHGIVHELRKDDLKFFSRQPNLAQRLHQSQHLATRPVRVGSCRCNNVLLLVAQARQPEHFANIPSEHFSHGRPQPPLNRMTNDGIEASRELLVHLLRRSGRHLVLLLCKHGEAAKVLLLHAMNQTKTADDNLFCIAFLESAVQERQHLLEKVLP